MQNKAQKGKLDDTLKPEVDRLLKIKQELPEMGLAPRVQILNDYIESTLEMIKNKADEIPAKNQNWDLLNTYFLSLFE